mmetsp:Transcript_42170/g.49274  ORF Transcript_42170/g.49274 Transcript_42170/m.49274 type:complete len:134 (-) Transcript_42170:118-519(-)
MDALFCTVTGSQGLPSTCGCNHGLSGYGAHCQPINETATEKTFSIEPPTNEVTKILPPTLSSTIPENNHHGSIVAGYEGDRRPKPTHNIVGHDHIAVQIHIQTDLQRHPWIPHPTTDAPLVVSRGTSLRAQQR